MAVLAPKKKKKSLFFAWKLASHVMLVISDVTKQKSQQQLRPVSAPETKRFFFVCCFFIFNRENFNILLIVTVTAI